MRLFGGRSNRSPVNAHVEPPRPMVARDVFGRELLAGDQVMITKPITPLLTITEIRPLMDPNMPAHLVLVVMQMTMVMKFAADVPTVDVVRVRTALEAGNVPESPQTQPDVAPPVAPTPTVEK